MPVGSGERQTGCWLRAYVPAAVMVFLFLCLYFITLGPALRRQERLVREVETEAQALDRIRERSGRLEILHRALESDPATQERALRVLYPRAAEPGEVRIKMSSVAPEETEAR